MVGLCIDMHHFPQFRQTSTLINHINKCFKKREGGFSLRVELIDLVRTFRNARNKRLVPAVLVKPEESSLLQSIPGKCSSLV